MRGRMMKTEVEEGQHRETGIREVVQRGQKETQGLEQRGEEGRTRGIDRRARQGAIRRGQEGEEADIGQVRRGVLTVLPMIPVLTVWCYSLD
jgi:hypothetical protein